MFEYWLVYLGLQAGPRLATQADAVGKRFASFLQRSRDLIEVVGQLWVHVSNVVVSTVSTGVSFKLS